MSGEGVTVVRRRSVGSAWHASGLRRHVDCDALVGPTVHDLWRNLADVDPGDLCRRCFGEVGS